MIIPSNTTTKTGVKNFPTLLIILFISNEKYSAIAKYPMINNTIDTLEKSDLNPNS